MKLRSINRISIFIWTLVISVGIIYLLNVNKQRDNAISQYEIAVEISSSTFDLSVLTSDYLLNHSPRTIQQWNIKHQHLKHLIASNNIEESLTFDIYLKRLDSLFQTIKLSQKVYYDELTPKQRRSATNLFITAIEMQSLSEDIQNIYLEELKDASNQLTIDFYIFIGGIIIFLIISSRMIL